MSISGGMAGTLARQEATQPPDREAIESRRFDAEHGDDSQADDLRVERALNEALERSSYPPLRTLRATLDRDVVRLEGCVRTYYQKQIAQQAAMDLLKLYAATQRLVNQVEVVR